MGLWDPQIVFSPAPKQNIFSSAPKNKGAKKVVLKPVQVIEKEYQVPSLRFPSHCPCCMKDPTGIYETEVRSRSIFGGGLNKKKIQVPYCLECIEHVKREKKYKLLINISQGILGVAVIGLGKFVGKVPISSLLPAIIGFLALFKVISSRKFDKEAHADKDESITFAVNKIKRKTVTDYPIIPGTDYAQVEVTLKNSKYYDLFKKQNESAIESG
ncbi:hypothetical protein JXI42_12905 [bacterium]|nr:hypothetical protein [bacterium]